MVRAFCFTLLLALIATAPAVAQHGPSFDCAKATDGAEKAICKSAGLSQLDRAIASAYAQARRKLDAAGQQALQEDQEVFLGSRETAIAEDARSLGEYMRERLTLLSHTVAPPAGSGEAAFLGQWHDASGFVRITRGAGGKLKVSISTSTPVTGMRACSVEDTVEPKDGRLAFRRPEFGVTIERKGTVLEVKQDGNTGTTCGQGSWLSGSYFRVNWPGKRELPH
jgi:uncharacterized protein